MVIAVLFWLYALAGLPDGASLGFVQVSAVGLPRGAQVAVLPEGAPGSWTVGLGIGR